MNMCVSILGLPEQSVEDIMNETPDDKKKDRIKIHKLRAMDGQGKQKELFCRNGGTPISKI